MNLYILRHGLAAERDSAKYPDDRLRPLTRKGIAKMRREAAGMNALNIRPDLIITSPLLRAVQTADIVRSELAAPPQLKQSQALTPSADPALLLQEIAASHSAIAGVMAVGHEPHLSSLVSAALTGRPTALIRLKKGALCNLKIYPSGRARLLWALTPAQLTALG